MKVILIKHVANLGDEGDVKEVAAGYARNFLLPRGLAEEATEAGMAAVAAKKAKKAKDAEMALSMAEEMVSKLEGQTIEITAKASEEGTLYAAVSASKIAKALEDKGFNIKKNNINTGHIKELGEHEVVISLDHGLEARISLIINSE